MTTLAIVDEPGGSTLLAFQDLAGTENPYGVVAQVVFDLDLGTFSPEYVVNEHVGDGAAVISSRHRLMQIRFGLKITAPDLASGLDYLSYAGALLAAGGYLEFSPDDAVESVYIPFEPSPELQLFAAQSLILELANRSPAVIPEVEVRMNRQPYSVGEELTAATNLVTNPTLTEDFGGTANRPDDWTWSGTTGLTGETIALVSDAGPRRGVYRFTKADAAAASLAQTTAVASYASGDIGVFSFDARVTAGTAKMRATLQFLQSNGSTTVGSLHSGTLTTLSSVWQRITVVTTAAGANTSRASVSLQIDNDAATSTTVEVSNAQAEKTVATSFRTAGEAVAYNPTSTSLPRKLPVWAGGSAPTPAELRVTADASGLARYRVYRVSERAVEILQATLHKSLRSGTLGADTTSTADADGIDGNVALVTYAEPDPAFTTDNDAGGSSITTISVTKPTSLAVGDFMIAAVAYGDDECEVIPPEGLQRLGASVLPGATVGGGQVFTLFVWTKTADADDVAASSFTFEVVIVSISSNDDYAAWIGRFQNIDPENPIDTHEFNAESGSATTSPTLLGLTTSDDDAMIVGIVIGADDNQAGSMTFTPPAGTTPTFTEAADRPTDRTWHALSVVNGVLATAGSTGDKDFTASISGYFATCHIALRKASAAVAPRSTVTYLGGGPGALPAGEYDVYLRYRASAVCQDRIRIEYAPQSGPPDTAWVALPDYILDTSGAASFSEYEERNFGRLAIPEGHPLGALTVRVSSGREASSSASLRLDSVYLAPAFERASSIYAPSQLTTSEILVADAADGSVYSLDSAGDLAEVGTVDGPPPIELAPGYQVLIVWPVLAPLVGYIDPATEVGQSATVAITHSPRYRT